MNIELTGEQLADVALSTLRAALGSERYQYLSGPITGGRRLLTWHLAEGRLLAAERRRNACRRAVIEPNIADLREEANRQRAAGIRTIEPGSFEADFVHWGQAEFLAFWDRVLERHASRVRFVSGWEFSAGCAFEYRRAAAHGLARVDVDGHELAPAAALDLLATALGRIDEAHDPADPRDEVLARLRDAIAFQTSLIAAIARG
ncbi:hypothetical protein SAMN06297144_0538 [Sphingomonas guangdongensis]|uniref:Uncharacterized protein n=1 Tax=Sphingomonas guangdongensis TaxID=1141890 RepID=A0A285QD16_9SPHN|nr:hypothetical protein [Sphingomonas guangdongensis]SOB79418.1 hypothetical protein SAMN06297144_0538 [Sphingomonas guangdongensis]